MALRDTSRYDVFISHSGVEIGYVLAEDPQTGFLQYLPGFVEEAAQQQSQGAFDYGSLPNTISTIISFENWAEGAGAVEVPSGTSTAAYSYSRGVDASWGSRLYLSPQRQSMTGLTTSLTKIYVSPSQGIYGLGGRYVYKLSGTVWSVSKDLGVGKTATDIIEYGNGTSTFVVVAQGDNDDMQYSTNAGTSWTASTGNAFTYLTVRGSFSTVPVLWGISTAGYLKSSTNVTAFSNADRLGHTGETTTDLLSAGGLIWAIKQSAIYSFDSVEIDDFLPTTNLAKSGNGANTFLWSVNDNFYVTFGGRLLEIDPVKRSIKTVFLMAHPELNGTITAITGTTDSIYFALKNTAGDTYIIKGNPILGTWHTWAYLGANDCNALDVATSGTVHSTRDTIVAGYGSSTTIYFILPIAGFRPEDDSSYRFDTGGGTLYGPLIDGGVLAIPKYANSGKVLAASLSATKTAVLSYSMDADTASTTVVTAVQTGLSETAINPPVLFNRIRYSLTLSSGSATSTPVVMGLAFDSTPNAPRRRQWTLGLVIEDEADPRGGGDRNRYSSSQLLEHLLDAGSVQITYTDYMGGEYVAKLRLLQLQGIKRKPVGKGRQAFTGIAQVVIAEIQPTLAASNTSGATLFRWGASAWGGPDVWG